MPVAPYCFEFLCQTGSIKITSVDLDCIQNPNKNRFFTFSSVIATSKKQQDPEAIETSIKIISTKIVSPFYQLWAIFSSSQSLKFSAKLENLQKQNFHNFSLSTPEIKDFWP
jgi:hypothetical protein